jgi:hypothetical protein
MLASSLLNSLRPLKKGINQIAPAYKQAIPQLINS